MALEHTDLALKATPSGYALEARAFALKGLGRPVEAADAFRLFLDHVETERPLEGSLEYRTRLAGQILEELERAGHGRADRATTSDPPA